MSRPFASVAQRFLVRRYGKAVDWRCTYREIAQATGIREQTVAAICRRHGYHLRDDSRAAADHLIAVDSYFRLTSANLRGRY